MPRITASTPRWSGRRLSWSPSRKTAKPPGAERTSLAGLAFLMLAAIGHWDKEYSMIAVGSIAGLFGASMLLAAILGSKLQLPRSSTFSRSGEPAP